MPSAKPKATGKEKKKAMRGERKQFLLGRSIFSSLSPTMWQRDDLIVDEIENRFSILSFPLTGSKREEPIVSLRAGSTIGLASLHRR